MHSLFDSTIVAQATPVGLGAVAVVRLSGPEAWAIAGRLFTPANGKPFAPWQAQYGVLHHSNQTTALLDEVLVLPFKGPKSFTGEDVVEFHVHGSPYVVQRVVAQCVAQGAVLAQKGEFSKRAFLNGRLDLSQAESILDVLHARGDAMLDAAAHNLHAHTLANYIQAMCDELIAIQAQIVASVDFPDEVDEPERGPLTTRLQHLDTQLLALEASGQASQVVRSGIKVALLGQPNAGKSSLFNRLLTSERAIVTPIAGTTRDTVEEVLTLHGVPVTLVDTAGLRDETQDAVERIGMERSWAAASQAHGVLYLYNGQQGLLPEDEQVLAELAQRLPHCSVQCLATHADLLPPVGAASSTLSVSSLTGEGLPQVLAVLKNWIDQATASGATLDGLHQQLCLNHRQQQCVVMAREAMAQTLQALHNPLSPLDLATVPLTDVLRSLDAMLGRDTTEDVLTEVFSQFCVGK